MKTALAIWILSGAYAVLVNRERIGRLWGARVGVDVLAEVFMALVGPFGLALVLYAGGRVCFWRKNEEAR